MQIVQLETQFASTIDNYNCRRLCVTSEEFTKHGRHCPTPETENGGHQNRKYSFQIAVHVTKPKASIE